MTDLRAERIGSVLHPVAPSLDRDVAQPPDPAAPPFPPSGSTRPSPQEAVTSDNGVAASCPHPPMAYCAQCLNCLDCPPGCTCELPDYQEEGFIA